MQQEHIPTHLKMSRAAEIYYQMLNLREDIPQKPAEQVLNPEITVRVIKPGSPTFIEEVQRIKSRQSTKPIKQVPPPESVKESMIKDITYASIHQQKQELAAKASCVSRRCQSRNHGSALRGGGMMSSSLMRSTRSEQRKDGGYSTQRGKKEILSPNYKPFEIFFSYRRNSPYVSKRSRVSDKKSSNGMSKRSSSQRDLSRTNSCCRLITTAAKGYGNSGSKRQSPLLTTVERQTIPSFLTANSPPSIRRGRNAGALGQTLTTPVFNKDFKHHHYFTTSQQQERQYDQFMIEPMLDEVKVDTEVQTELQAADIDTLGHQCCHGEGMRHQVTRFALEKALKLSEVLMQEITRLDKTVKRQELQIQRLTGQQEVQPMDDDLMQLMDSKRSLLKDITNLHQISSECEQPVEMMGRLHGLYHEQKQQVKQCAPAIQEKENYQQLSQRMLSEVAECLEAHKMM